MMENMLPNEYLNIDKSVEFIRKKLETEFFSESDLFDLCVSNKIKPIIYYNGQLWTSPEKENSIYPDDFDGLGDDTGIDLEFSQLNYFIGYLYLNHVGRDGTSFNDIVHRSSASVQNVIAYQPMLNKYAINKHNKHHGIYFSSKIKNGDLILFANEFASYDLQDFIKKKEGFVFEMEHAKEYGGLFEEIHELTSLKLAINRDSLIFHVKDLLRLVDKNLFKLIENLNNVEEFFEHLVGEFEKGIQAKDDEITALKARIAELEQAQSTEKVQGDLLLTLGAVMDCLPSIAKTNYTQARLIDGITETYGHIKGISTSTLQKQFAKAKEHLEKEK